ncbi:hypothetical protein BD289DRAFT_374788 [Coniella lustricola]|uniref:Probable guanine deaminase n=1 Tax=Coniella lustricola TaxID=2025994 RepID=A0A2T2ZZB4_9PEZI|nr:hypothetical protein BD289DRAFT_374788 [Coniella lustricola]
MAQPLPRPLVFHGPVIHSLSPTVLESVPSALLVVDTTGHIIFFSKDSPTLPDPIILPNDGNNNNDKALALSDCTVHRLAPASPSQPPTRFLIPGFVDTHNHAPQWAQRGLGQGLHILDWLERITFPNEARFADPAYARRIYTACVAGFLRQGITTASYYGSAHGPATAVLADICVQQGQRALVGKCNMDRNAPDYYRDASAEESLATTEQCIAHIRALDPNGELVQPVLTPRFAITCTPALLQGLGDIAAREPHMAVQTHFNEAKQEMDATRALFPHFGGSEAALYSHYGLLTPRTILAHCCFMDERELDAVGTAGCGVAHCPISNMTVGGGFMAAPVRQFLHRGWQKVGLGTDSGGGFSSSMLDAMRQALVAGHAREVMTEGKDKGLRLEEVFYMATLGGARVCSLGDKVGCFEVGKEFDACVVESGWNREQQVMAMVEEEDSLATVFEKFIMTGDDRNIRRVFVRGRQVK